MRFSNYLFWRGEGGGGEGGAGGGEERTQHIKNLCPVVHLLKKNYMERKQKSWI